MNSPVELIDVRPGDTNLLQEVVRLGDESRQTLGFLPHVVFGQAADSKTLIAAVQNGNVVGYVLYNLPRQHIKLTHLCVSKDLRGHGIARQLVEAISSRHADRFGISLKCRTDYSANSLWPHLGFTPQGQVPGRSKQRHPLSVWWRDHGHPNLFSAAEAIGLLRVAIDHNVFLDLEAGSERPGASESKALTADWLADQIELTVTTELLREITRLPDGPDKSQQCLAERRYPRLAVQDSAARALAQRITEHVARIQGLDLSVKDSDVSDVRHVAEASLTGVTVLATRDEELLNWSSQVIDITGVRVMRPADVILQVDELARAQAYRPVQLWDTEYRLTPVRSGAETELLAFLHGNEGEQKAKYLARIRKLLAEGQQWTRTVLHSPDEKPIAFFVTGAQRDELIVPVFRVVSHRLSETVGRQLLFLLRNQALREKHSIVRITEPSLGSQLQRILREDGFIPVDGEWVGLVVFACGTAAIVDDLTTQAARLAGLRLQSLVPGLSPVIAADLERRLWPAKITDSGLPTYVVPIRPEWSTELFGIPQSLTRRSGMLGLSREHVYYRKPTTRLATPARLVWYVTDAKGGRGGVTAVIGCSRLEETVTDKPVVLFRRFRHLGVWKQDQISASAGANGDVQALRFADTEIFPRRVSLRRAQQLAHKHGTALALRSAQKISPELFAVVYQEGHPPGDGTRSSHALVSPSPLR